MSNPPAFGARMSALVPSSSKGSEEAINPANSAEDKLEVQKEMRTRIPMSVPRAKMATPEIPGYHSHWINDYAGRVMQAQAAGYSFVNQDEVLISMPGLANDILGTGTDLGTRVSIVVGKNEDGSPLRAYLMKLGDEFYKEDLLAGQERVNQVHDAMQQAKLRPSGVTMTEGDLRNQYAAGHIKSITKSSTYAPQQRR
jgi:hypothetical protein